jgi:hypothetical protein
MPFILDEGHATSNAKALDHSVCGLPFERNFTAFYGNRWSTFGMFSSHGATIGNASELCGFASL